MGIAIIRNAKHTLGRLTWVYSHNERKNTNYSNKYFFIHHLPPFT